MTDPKAQFDKFINITKESIRDYYEIYGIELKELENHPQPQEISVAAKTSIRSELFNGQIQFLYQKENFLTVFAKAFMKKGEVPLNDHNAEGAQEILNVVCGAIHRKINNYGEYEVDYSIPSYDWGEFLTPDREPNSIVIAFSDPHNSLLFVQFDIEFN